MIPLIALLLLASEEVTTEHYRVVSTYGNRDYVRRIADGLQENHGRLADLLGIEPREAKRYTIWLYATLEEYVAKDKELTQGRFANNGAFSSRLTQESHILVQPRTGVPLFERTEALVHHGAFHLMAYRHAGWLDSAPAWLSEGLAERAAEICMKRETVKFGSSTRLVQRLLERRRWIPLEELLSLDQSSNPDSLVRWAWYAESWLLVKYLAEKRPDVWTAFAKRQAALPARDRGTARTRTLLLDAAGASLRELEDDWIAWIRALAPPPWVLIDGDWRLTSEGVEGAAYGKSTALLASTEVLKTAKYTLKFDVRLQDEGASQADIFLMPSWELRGLNLVKVCLNRQAGVAAVLVRKDGDWRRVAFREVSREKLPGDRWLNLEVEVDGRAIRLRLQGETVVEHTFDDPDVRLDDVVWGVGSFDGWVHFRRR